MYRRTLWTISLQLRKRLQTDCPNWFYQWLSTKLPPILSLENLITLISNSPAVWLTYKTVGLSGIIPFLLMNSLLARHFTMALFGTLNYMISQTVSSTSIGGYMYSPNLLLPLWHIPFKLCLKIWWFNTKRRILWLYPVTMLPK